MKILGIDPGMAIVGYSIVDFDGENVKPGIQKIIGNFQRYENYC